MALLFVVISMSFFASSLAAVLIDQEVSSKAPEPMEPIKLLKSPTPDKYGKEDAHQKLISAVHEIPEKVMSVIHEVPEKVMSAIPPEVLNSGHELIEKVMIPKDCIANVLESKLMEIKAGTKFGLDLAKKGLIKVGHIILKPVALLVGTKAAIAGTGIKLAGAGVTLAGLKIASKGAKVTASGSKTKGVGAVLIGYALEKKMDKFGKFHKLDSLKNKY